MNDRDVLLVGGGVGLVALLLVSSRDAAASSSTAAPTPTDEGRRAPPGSGAPGEREARVFETSEVRTLARIIRSEAGNGPAAERVAVAWVARNLAASNGRTLLSWVGSPTGHGGVGRPFSTWLPPRASDLQLADRILAAPPSEDPTGGATNAFQPALQDKLFRAGRKGYTKNADQVRELWKRRGLALYGTVGTWELYGPKRDPAWGASP